MKKNIKKIKKAYLRVLNSLIFYPALLIIAFSILSCILISHENYAFDQYFREKLPNFYLQDLDTAKTILSTLIGSIISLMVFSFSMVMVVLSQAMSNFSPRLLPQLISDKKRQLVLGVYAGTLVHCILVLISLGSGKASNYAMGLPTMVAAALGVICVLLFVFFIQNISSIVRIDIIVKEIFDKADKLLAKELQKKAYDKDEDLSQWISIKSDRTGYFKGFDKSLLNSYFENLDNSIHIIPFEYEHVWEGDVVLRIRKDIPKNNRDNLLICMTITEDRYKGNSSTSGLIKLMEVAVKAMSPGKNDPGTASDVLHKLGRLLSCALKLPLSSYDLKENSSLEIVQANISTKELMRLIIQPIRNYSKSDSYVIVELIKTLQYLIENTDIKSSKLKGVEEELKSLIDDVKVHVKNEMDRERLLSFVSEDFKK